MKILFGVFDWGLGHATRDTPLIRALLAGGHRVDLLSTGRALKVLDDRFGNDCRSFDVPSLRSPYTQSRFFVLSFTFMLPAMLRSLIQARRQTQAILRRERYDLVISDCRYDVYDQPGNSILINHQLRFHSFPVGEQIMERWLAAQMNHYRVVAVPDYPTNSLSGRLSHDLRYFDPNRIRYVGILSHVRKLAGPAAPDRDIDYFISISGPEPQRTALEEIVLAQVGRGSLTGRIVITAGNPDRQVAQVSNLCHPAAAAQTSGDVQFYNYLDQARQEEMTNRAKMMISRSGYTTIMEQAEVGVPRSLTIPTPGQPEQEYLSRYYEATNKAPFVSQYDLQLDRDVARAKQYGGFFVPWRTEQSVRNFMELCG